MHEAGRDARFETLGLALDDAAPPGDARRIIERCAGEAAEVLALRGEGRIPAFQHSTGWTPWQLLAAIDAAGVAAGPRFVEWGSGLGVTALLAARQGFRATGIEIEPGLVARARRLAEELDVPATFLRGDLFASGPMEGAGPEGAAEATDWPLLGADVVYAYPWPAEAPRLVERFAERRPNPGALLVLYHGGPRFEVLRWVGAA